MPLNNVFDFLYNYIIYPLKHDTGYNIVNTALIAFLFVWAAWFLWEYIFKDEKIPLDKTFILSLIPWLLFGSTSRVLEDAGIVTSILFITPIIYFWAGLITISTLMVALKIEQHDPKLQYWKTWGIVGLLLAVFNISLMSWAAPQALVPIAWIMFLWYLIFSLSGTAFFKKVKYNVYKSKLNRFTLLSQLLDGTSSFIGITYFGYWEKHILGRSLLEFLETKNIFLINSSGAWIIILLKVVVITLVLYYIDRYAESEREAKFLKILILALGLTLGLRNSIEIAALG